MPHVTCQESIGFKPSFRRRPPVKATPPLYMVTAGSPARFRPPNLGSGSGQRFREMKPNGGFPGTLLTWKYRDRVLRFSALCRKSRTAALHAAGNRFPDSLPRLTSQIQCPRFPGFYGNKEMTERDSNKWDLYSSDISSARFVS